MECNRLLPIFWLLVCSDRVSCQGWVYADEGCVTPTGGNGDCIPIRNCQPMTDFLTTASKPLSDRIRDRLNRYRCSYENGMVHVCCPNDPIVIDDERPKPTPKQPNDLSKHKYFNLLPKNCGYVNEDDKIKHGMNTSLNEFPWMALLNYQSSVKNPNFKCGGTIINDRWILTAAHCITNLKEALKSVRIGEHNTRTKIDCELRPNGKNKCSPPFQDLKIEKIIRHPSFRVDVIENDIGLIKVSRMNLQRPNAKPVCLPTDPSITEENFEDGVVTGWGITETGLTSSILQKVFLPLVELQGCQRVYENQPNAKVTDRQFCAGGKDDKDACPGDSGGPMQIVTFLNNEVRVVQLGIVSYGPTVCGSEGFPGVYTKIAPYMDWILNTIGQN